MGELDCCCGDCDSHKHRRLSLPVYTITVFSAKNNLKPKPKPTIDAIKKSIESGRKIASTAISAAIDTGVLEFVQYLISKNAPIYPTALTSAINSGKIEFVKLIYNQLAANEYT